MPAPGDRPPRLTPRDAGLGRLRGNLPGVAWPAVISGAAATLAALVDELDGTQWLAPEVLASRQRLQLRLLARHLASHSSHFAARLAAAGLRADDLGEEGGLQQLPILTRREIQSSGDRLFAASVPRGHEPIARMSTSGSTGEPVVVRRTRLNGVLWGAVTLRDHLWRGVDFRSRLSAIRANLADYKESSTWGRPVDHLFESGPSQAIPISAPLDDMARMLQRFGPQVLLVYPSTLGGLNRWLAERGERLGDLRWIHTIGETVAPRIREETLALHGVDLWDSYSSQELGNVALECPERRGHYHVMAETHVVEVLDDHGRRCAEGQTGRLVITDLHNFATPLVRYDIGDYAEVGGPCACGRGLPALRRILGRERNLVVLPDGSRHWPLVGFDHFRGIAPITQYQLVQREAEAIDVRLVVERPLTEIQREALGAVIRGALGYPFRLRFEERSERIPTGPNGKFEEFRCELEAVAEGERPSGSQTRGGV